MPARGKGDTMVGGTGGARLSTAEALGHTVVFGSGSDEKRSVLLDFMEAAAADGTGALMIDGSGDPDLRFLVEDICRRNGRMEDLWVVDFRASGTPGDGRRLDLFRGAPPEAVTAMLAALLDESMGDGAMWKGRALSMLAAVVPALCWLQDKGELVLSAGIVSDYISLMALVDLADPKTYPDMPANIRKPVRAYLKSLPGFMEEKGRAQSQTTRDQHGYLEMCFTRGLATLDRHAPRILESSVTGRSMAEAMASDMVTLVLLPSLETAHGEAGVMGKLVLAGLRQAIASAVAAGRRGKWRFPFFRVVLSELPDYMLDGMGKLLQVGRVAGVAVTASADSPARLEMANPAEARAVIDNSWNRIYLRMASPEAAAHVRGLPLSFLARRRMLGMGSGDAALVAGRKARFFKVGTSGP